MSSSSTTEWLCDRCNRKAALPLSQQPRAWHSLREANPPNHAEPNLVGDVCNICWDEFCTWWRSWENNDG